MKQKLFKNLMIAGVATLALPALSQAQTRNSSVRNRDGNIQTITITRTDNKDEKLNIEVDGDEVKINGRPAKENKDVNVNVTTTVTGFGQQNRGNVRVFSNGNSWSFNTDVDHGMSLMSDDENRAMLGVNTEDHEDGAKVVSVTKESAASKAGIMKGDIITKIDRSDIEDANDITEVIRTHKPGDRVSVTVERDGRKQTVDAELGKWKGVKIDDLTVEGYRLARPVVPQTPPNPPAAPKEFRGYDNQLKAYRENTELFQTDLNKKVQADLNKNRALTDAYTFGFQTTGKPRLGLSIQDTDDGKGAKILDLDEDGNAAKAGLQEGDIIIGVDDVDVNGADDVTRAIRQSSRDKYSYDFKVNRKGRTQTIEVRLPRKLKTADL